MAANMVNRLERLLVIVGCAKCGTTALAGFLGMCPEIVLGRVKEPRHFTTMADTPWSGPASERFSRSILVRREVFLANFDGLSEGQWALDASTDYIWRPETPELLKNFSRDAEVRLICITRDPVDRAISEYNHTRRYGWETLSFAKAVDAEPERISTHWLPLFRHRRRSTIAADLARFRAAFGDDLLVLDYAELKYPEAVMSRICGFLGLPYRPVTEIPIANRSFLPRNEMAARLLKSGSLRTLARALVPQQLRREAYKRLRTDARNVATVTPLEIELFRGIMAEEIARCRDDPGIPTANWKLAQSGRP